MSCAEKMTQKSTKMESKTIQEKHKRRKYLRQEEKLEVVELYLLEGRKQAELAKMYDIDPAPPFTREEYGEA